MQISKRKFNRGARMKIKSFGLAAATILAFAGSASASTITTNASLPEGWANGTGTSNGNFTIDTETDGAILGLRAAVRFVGAITPNGGNTNVYTAPIGFGTGAGAGAALWNFEYSYDPGTMTGTVTTLTISDNHGNNFGIPLFLFPDNTSAGTAQQNSENISFFPFDLAPFNPTVPAIYSIDLAMTSATGSPIGSVDIQVNVGAVPEPSTWAMMVLGFAGIGAMTYRRRKTAALAA
jgi:hypothetical protein